MSSAVWREFSADPEGICGAMRRDRSRKALRVVGMAFLVPLVLSAGLACSGRGATVATQAPSRVGVRTTTTGPATTMVATTEGTSSRTAVSAVVTAEMQKVLDQLEGVAGQTSFTLYYLGSTYGNASIAGMMAQSKDPGASPGLVDIIYRSARSQDRLVVYLSQYDPTLRADLEKPLSDWTFVREVRTDGYTDAIYRSGDHTEALFYVAQRGSTEISLAGYTSSGYLEEEQLIDIAPRLVPVL